MTPLECCECGQQVGSSWARQDVLEGIELIMFSWSSTQTLLCVSAAVTLTVLGTGNTAHFWYAGLRVQSSGLGRWSQRTLQTALRDRESMAGLSLSCTLSL